MIITTNEFWGKILTRGLHIDTRTPCFDLSRWDTWVCVCIIIHMYVYSPACLGEAVSWKENNPDVDKKYDGLFLGRGGGEGMESGVVYNQSFYKQTILLAEVYISLCLCLSVSLLGMGIGDWFICDKKTIYPPSMDILEDGLSGKHLFYPPKIENSSWNFLSTGPRDRLDRYWLIPWVRGISWYMEFRV